MIPTGLPPPDADAAGHSARVQDAVDAAIRAAGDCLPFDEYMTLVLYAPGLGYYSAGSTKLGPAGDFTTAPELSAVFGGCVANGIAEVLAAVDGGSVLELGAGSGRLARDTLLALDRLGTRPARYEILEVSPDLRARQAELLAGLPAALRARVHWRESLPAAGFRGVILANEVLDALPVRRFRVTEHGVAELGVGGARDARRWVTRPAPAALEGRVRTIEAELGRAFSAGYESEVSAYLPGFVASLGDALELGSILLIDYGCPRHEYYAPDRRRGTLACFYRHRMHDDPLVLEGLQDLTAWVDFTAVAEAATARGLDIAGYTTQSQFLLDAGFTAEVERVCAPLADLARVNALSAAQTLVLPGEMGERFKCIALTRGVDVMTGFRGRDYTNRL